MRSIYFAGSIKGGRQDAAIYSEIIKLLEVHGRVLTEHVGNAELDGQGETRDDTSIHDRDMAWLKEASALVAEVSVPSLGVGYEVGRAAEWSKPVLCLFRSGSGVPLSSMIAGCKDVTVKRYTNLNEVPEMLKQFFAAI